ncbi:MAG TPA: methylated-DNA--[protein]-cysteine S-methyltransferase [Candidatus Saccharimonadales bacterium]|nr:methylated-DNA--[protein]-cysteine S-methyltransferase [Candidatus Saccharimonadales bacterium]
MSRADAGFRGRVLSVVAQIPKGKVMTYGQIASLCGNPRAARIVGGIAHWDDQNLPWQRVVHKNGKLATGFPGGVEGHRQVLEVEGVLISKDFQIDIERYIFHPSQRNKV